MAGEEQAKTESAAATQEAAKPVKEKQANCLGCGKPLKKIKRYYRDGVFYCTKKCWRKKKDEAKNKDAKE